MNDPQFDVGEKPEGSAPPQDTAYYVEPPKQGRGCLFYGCLAAVVAGLIGAVLVGGALYMGWYYYTRLVDEYTATEPLQLPAVEATEEQVADVEARWKAFKDALDKGEETEIVLSQDDVNILASREPQLKDHVYFTLEDDKAKVELSYDLSKTGLPRTRGRFLNAKGTITAEVNESGRMDVRLFDIEVGGKTLPPDLAKGIGAENLADEFVDNPENREFMEKIERVEVKESKVYIKTRGKSEASKADAAEEPAGDEPAAKAKEPSEPEGKQSTEPTPEPKTPAEVPKEAPAKEEGAPPPVAEQPAA